MTSHIQHAMTGIARITDATVVPALPARPADDDSTFTPLTCSQCPTGRYRDDQEPDPVWDAPEAEWRCNVCGNPTSVDAMEFEPAEVWTVRDHTLGYVTHPDPLLPARMEPLPGGETTAPGISVTEVTATLLVDDFESRCGNCRKQTLLHGVTRHTDISGWRPKPGGGCGARFVNTASLSRAVSSDRLRELRPDLPVQELDT
ncbi:hypothetical protein AB0N09_05990 [Streptomyces erythrochromogenes]|uniref:hypothetical protein n=1 Tax=Streptomyces erythrochromogenes TaxID=285574 RepID=UPI00343E4875